MGALAAPLLAVGSGVMTYMSGRQQVMMLRHRHKNRMRL